MGSDPSLDSKIATHHDENSNAEASSREPEFKGSFQFYSAWECDDKDGPSDDVVTHDAVPAWDSMRVARQYSRLYPGLVVAVLPFVRATKALIHTAVVYWNYGGRQEPRMAQSPHHDPPF